MSYFDSFENNITVQNADIKLSTKRKNNIKIIKRRIQYVKIGNSKRALSQGNMSRWR